MISTSDSFVPINLFVYGTLMDDEIMRHVSGRHFRCEPATLEGYVRKKVRGEVYPAIIPRAGDKVSGLLCYSVGGRALKRLDRFEGAPYERSPVRVVTAQGQIVPAEAYLFTEQNRSLLSDEDWHFEAFRSTAKRYFREKYWGYRALQKEEEE